LKAASLMRLSSSAECVSVPTWPQLMSSGLYPKCSLEPIEHRVDLGLAGDEGVEGGLLVVAAHGGLLRW
jgi:hypothetical protein